MAAQQRLQALGRRLDRLAEPGQKPADVWAEDCADTWQALVEVNEPAQNGPPAHRQRLEVLRTVAGLLPKLLRCGPALQASLPEGSVFVAGLLHLGSMALDILLEALDRPPPGCPPPPDDVCFRVTSWTAALLAPATTMLRFRDDLVTPAALMSAARPLKLLMTRLELSDGAPFAAALRAGAARPQLLAAALQELIGAAIYVQRLQGFSEQHRTSTWKDCTQAVTVLYTPGWEETLRLVLRGRPAAGQEAAALILRFARHAALEAVAGADPSDDTAWRQVASCAYGAGHTEALTPEVASFMQGSEGDSVQQAMASFLSAIPRKPPAGKAASDHAVLLCLSAQAALRLQHLALCEARVAGGAAVATLRLRAEVTVAATDALTAATERCATALDGNTALGTGPLQAMQCRSVWYSALNAWFTSHGGASKETMRAAPFLLRQATAAHSPEERAAVWSVVGNLAAAAERLLRLLPKLPRGGIYDMAATLAPGSAFAEGAMLLTAAAAHAAQQLSSDAMQQQRQQRQQLRQQMPPDAAAAAASASLAALAYTLAKRALLWADTPAGRGAEAALALRRSMLPSLDPQLTAAAADRDGRLMAVQLLAELLPGCAYSLGAAGKVEDPQDPMRQYSKIWPLVRVMGTAAEALGATIPGAEEAVAHVRQAAADAAPGPSSRIVRPDPSAPPELVELLGLSERACYNPRCCNLASASEAQLKGKLCTGCRVARFCCMDCSKAVWKEHKADCKFMQRMRREQAAADAAGEGEGEGGSSPSA